MVSAGLKMPGKILGLPPSIYEGLLPLSTLQRRWGHQECALWVGLSASMDGVAPLGKGLGHSPSSCALPGTLAG
jgi:hypothetical protein